MTEEDPAGVTSRYMIDSITIPTCLTKYEDEEKRKKKFTAFQIEVRTHSGLTWTVDHRYRQFLALNKALVSRFSSLRDFKFPPKKWFSSFTTNTVERRRQQFEQYLQELLSLQPRPLEVNQFLEITSHLYGNGGTVGGSEAASRSGDGAARKESSLERMKAGRVGVDDFELLKVLGKGSFGKVFLVRLIPTGEFYAMKVLKKSDVKRRRQVEHTKAERRIMGDVDFPFVVALRFAFQTADKLYMVTDYCQGGELFFHLKKMRSFPESMVRFFAAELVLALEHLHKLGIIYRDLKPENILLDENGHLHLTDFGLSKDEVEDDKGATTFCGTPEYLAPEMLINRKTREGTLIYEMLTGWPPFYDKNIRKMCEQILKSELTFPPTLTVGAEVRDLIRGLLDRNPATRLGSGPGGAEDIKNHPFFAGLDWDKLMRLEVEPPFKPKVESETDLNNFDSTFTSEPAVLTPPDSTPMGAAAAAADPDFSEFTYLDRSKLAVAGDGGSGDDGDASPEFSDEESEKE